MSFDSSRFTFDPWNDFLGVVMQQGRVQLDSDWNEWLAEFSRRVRAGTLDTFGRAVVPRTTPQGFQVSLAGGSLSIGQGRIYVDGLLVENHGAPAQNSQQWVPPSLSSTPPSRNWDSTLDELVGVAGVDYQQQPYYPNAAPLDQAGGPYLIYLDVWVREVTFLQNPDLVEKAVGVDTTGRLQIAWQVKWMDAGAGATCDSSIPAWDQLLLPPGPRLTTGVVQSSSSGPCCLTPNTGYTGLENQLYRVEIHQPGVQFPSTGTPATAATPPGVASFKFSCDDASVVASVLGIATGGTLLTVDSTGKDAVLRFNVNDWVEITDDFLELNGLPGELHQISGISDAEKTMMLSSAVSPANFSQDPATLAARHTRVTRWNQASKILQNNGTLWVDLDVPGSTGDIPVPPAGVTLLLENGVTVSFDRAATGGDFRSADYWTFAARSSDGSVESLDGAPPRGIFHHYARLAILGPSRVPLSSSPGVTTTLQDQSQPPVPFLTFQTTDPSQWPPLFGVLVRANAANPSSFDLEVVYNPAVSQGVTAPVVLEFFSNLSLDPNSVNYAPSILNAGSGLITVPSSNQPPASTPVFPADFPATPVSLGASGNIDLSDASATPSRFLTLSVASPANWPQNFAVSAGSSSTAGQFDLAVTYSVPGSNSFAVIEHFANLSAANAGSAINGNSAFLAGVVGLQVSSPLNLNSLTDCRSLWPPSPQRAAMHVTAINWSNDDHLPEAVFRRGLHITLDAPPDPNSVKPSTVIVTLEEPVGAPNFAVAEILQPSKGSPSVAGNVIDWIPDPALTSAELTAGLRVRVTLKGACIWSPAGRPRLYLDGQALGHPVTGSGGPVIALTLPSGNGQRASDFEGWFTLTPTPPLIVTLTPVPPLAVRAAGLTEPVGDLVLTITGGIPTALGQPVPLVSVTVMLNTAVTSRLFTAPLQDAALLIDDPVVLNTAALNTASVPMGVGGSGIDFKSGEAANIVIGSVGSAANAVSFSNVPLDPPGAGQRTFRITNLRVDASALQVASPGSASSVIAVVSMTGGVQIPGAQQTVGVLAPPVTTQVSSLSGSGAPSSGPFSISPKVGVNAGLAASPQANSGLIDTIVAFRVASPGSFRPVTQTPPPAIGALHQAEDSFTAAGLPLAVNAAPIPATEPMGHADQGTLFVAHFQNVPAGVQVFVTTRDLPSKGINGGNPNNPPPQAVLVNNEGGGGAPPPGVPRGTGGLTAGPAPFVGIPIASVTLTKGRGQAVWEWVATPQPVATQALEFGVLFAAAPDALTGAQPGPATVNLSLGPRSTDHSASQGDFIPRFIDDSQPSPLFVVTAP